MRRLLFLLVFMAFSLCVGAEDPKPYAIAVIGDNGCGCTEQGLVADRMIQWYQEKPFEIVLMLGDNIYGQNFLLRGGNKKLFPARFDKYYKPLIDKGVKFYAVLGNHDMETRDGRDEVEDVNRFHILGKDGYYTYTPDVKFEGRPLVTFFGIDSESLTSKKATPQIEWLSKTITENDAIWEIPFFHHPIYTPPGTHKDDDDVRTHIESILVAAGVRVTLSGHNHFYARMKPQQNVIHFVSGGGGRSIKTPKKDDRAAEVLGTPHFLYMEIYPERINFWAIPPKGPHFDQGSIQREALVGE